MLGLIYRFLIGSFHICHHDFEIIDTYTDSYGYKIFTSKCKNCGKLKSFRSCGN